MPARRDQPNERTKEQNIDMVKCVAMCVCYLTQWRNRPFSFFVFVFFYQFVIGLLIFDFSDFGAWNADFHALLDRWWCFDGTLRSAYHICRYRFRFLMRFSYIKRLKFHCIWRLFNALRRTFLHLQFTFNWAMSQFFKTHLKAPHWFWFGGKS